MADQERSRSDPPPPPDLFARGGATPCAFGYKRVLIASELAQAALMGSSRPLDRLRSAPAQAGTVVSLYDYVLPEPRLGRPAETLEDWRVVDDWPDRVPVTEREVDVFEAWFGDVLDELFGPV